MRIQFECLVYVLLYTRMDQHHSTSIKHLRIYYDDDKCIWKFITQINYSSQMELNEMLFWCSDMKSSSSSLLLEICSSFFLLINYIQCSVFGKIWANGEFMVLTVSQNVLIDWYFFCFDEAIHYSLCQQSFHLQMQMFRFRVHVRLRWFAANLHGVFAFLLNNSIVELLPRLL